jgi:hypothetical protein
MFVAWRSGSPLSGTSLARRPQTRVVMWRSTPDNCGHATYISSSMIRIAISLAAYQALASTIAEGRDARPQSPLKLVRALACGSTTSPLRCCACANAATARGVRGMEHLPWSQRKKRGPPRGDPFGDVSRKKAIRSPAPDPSSSGGMPRSRGRQSRGPSSPKSRARERFQG